MTLQKITRTIVVGTALVLIAYDVYAALVGGEQDTESNFIINASSKALAIPFGAGILCQHFFNLL